MSEPRETWRSRLRDFFALGDDWARPVEGITRRDIAVTVVIGALALFVVELMRGLGSLNSIELPRWRQWVYVLLPVLPLVARRRYPLSALVVGTVVSTLIAADEPLMFGLLSTQIVYFFLVLSAVAWARRRDMALLVISLMLASMALWLVWGFAVGNAMRDYVVAEDVEGPHVPPSIAAVLLAGTVNVLYFGGAVIGGQVSWRAARQRARLQEQSATIARQAEELRERAVVEERLRIARELHDVVAHHVSATGVQAAAARRVLDRSPEQAQRALASIESSSREAVTQMRGLLGTLRSVSGGEDEGGRLAPAPGVGDIPALVEEARAQGLQVDAELVEEAPGDAERIPGSVGQSLYRTAQEALTNVARHSTAASARLVLRVSAQHVEVEITDDGRPRGDSAGTGMGHLGIRERAASHHGVVEVGPRPTGGYRVRLRVPLGGCDVR